jgi:hypothetical protein
VTICLPHTVCNLQSAAKGPLTSMDAGSGDARTEYGAPDKRDPAADQRS